MEANLVLEVVHCMSEIHSVYPGNDWVKSRPSEVNMDEDALNQIELELNKELDKDGYSRYRVVIVRYGRLVAEWHKGIQPQAQLWMESATKSIFSCILGIAIDKGGINSADSKLIDYYPEAMDVPEGMGPKPGRYAFPKDRDITLRQLITNTSGYMKPGENPGTKYHYQSYGMNVLNHAIAKSYGLYDVNKPHESRYNQLVDNWIRKEIGASWSYYTFNFIPDESGVGKTNIFGYYDGVAANALDLARLGLLWLNMGVWNKKQIVPHEWLTMATKTASAIVDNCPKEQWQYGHGFWTNDHKQYSPNLPSDSFAAAGYGHQHVWVCPSLDLVVAQGPGIWKSQENRGNQSLLRKVVESCM